MLHDTPCMHILLIAHCAIIAGHLTTYLICKTQQWSIDYGCGASRRSVVVQVGRQRETGCCHLRSTLYLFLTGHPNLATTQPVIIASVRDQSATLWNGWTNKEGVAETMHYAAAAAGGWEQFGRAGHTSMMVVVVVALLGDVSATVCGGTTRTESVCVP